jgi:hypothetical protein
MANILKPRYNDPFNNKIPEINNLILGPSVVNFTIKSPCNNKTPAVKNKIFGPFRFGKPRLQFNVIRCNDNSTKGYL